jgi:hypothetical protein
MIVVENIGYNKYRVTDMDSGMTGTFTATAEQVEELKRRADEVERHKRGAA